MTEFKNDILEEADKIINGERNDDYGKPEDCFREVARYWNTYIRAIIAKGDSGKPLYHWQEIINSHDVAMMMVLLKVARTNKSKKKDNYVDIAGYAAIAEKL